MSQNKDIPTSSTLLELCRQDKSGASDSWNRLLSLYRKLIFYWILEFGIAPTDRDDVYQDVCFTLAKELKKFKRRGPRTFRGWLRHIVHSRCMDFHNRYKKNKMSRLTDGGAKIPDKYDSAAVDSFLDDNAIPAEQKRKEDSILRNSLKALLKQKFQDVHVEAFMLYMKNTLNAREIGDKLGLEHDNVRQIVCRVKKYLKDNFEDVL